jgi:ArsR family transcriptional regulator
MQVDKPGSESSSQVFRALADATRRRILQLLREGPLTSGQIADRFDSSWPTISRHLAVLRDAGLVMTERNGQEIRYELNTSVFQELVQHLIEWTRPTGRGLRRTTKRGRPRPREV